MIDLNSIVFDQKFQREQLLAFVSQEEIYIHYIGDKFLTQRVFNSPLRNDNIPSFSIYRHRDFHDKLMYKDLATGISGDCFLLVSRMFGITLKEAFYKIAFDFGLSFSNISNPRQYDNIVKAPKLMEKELVKLEVRTRPWLKKDMFFWKQFGIKKETLVKFDVKPIDYIFFNGNPIKAENLSYAYREIKDNVVSFKVYQPESEFYKWINSANSTIHQGYNQLPKTGELLIITKSLKDVMSLFDNANIPSIGLQSESVSIKPSVLEEYKSRFKRVICLFDNDEAGVKFSIKTSQECDIDYFLLPKLDKVTDFSDLIKQKKVKQGLVIFNKSLKLMNKNTN